MTVHLQTQTGGLHAQEHSHPVGIGRRHRFIGPACALAGPSGEIDDGLVSDDDLERLSDGRVWRLLGHQSA